MEKSRKKENWYAPVIDYNVKSANLRKGRKKEEEKENVI